MSESVLIGGVGSGLGAIGKEPYGDYQTINPDEIAKTYLQFHQQDKSAWSWEVELRTSMEKF